MTKNDKITNVSPTIAKELSKCGANFQPYVQSPVRGAGLILRRVGDDVVKVAATSLPEIDIAVNKEHTQAVITAIEEKRTLEADHKVSWAIDTSVSHEDNYEEIRKNNFNGFNPFEVPNATRSSRLVTDKDTLIKRIKQARKENRDDKHVSNYWNISLDLHSIAHCKESTQSFLTGIDEVAHFVCALPKVVKSVEEAHDVLRPKNVPEGTLRQGEFFFIPVNNRELELTIFKEGIRVYKTYQTRYESAKGIPLEFATSRRASSHRADVVIKYKNKTYAYGLVSDARKTRHEPILLKDLHEVIRNKEIPVKEPRNERYFD